MVLERVGLRRRFCIRKIDEVCDDSDSLYEFQEILKEGLEDYLSMRLSIKFTRCTRSALYFALLMCFSASSGKSAGRC